MTEKEKMLASKLYDPSDAELTAIRRIAHDGCTRYNMLPEADPERKEILKKIIPNAKKGVYLQGPIQFDYGVFTTMGENNYANFNFTVLDCAPVTIGDNVFFGPNVAIYTPVHPLLFTERNQYIKENGELGDHEYALPVTIGDNCWIAGNVTICGGVTIGSGCVIGAGSVVTRDIPPSHLAFGNPCRPIRQLTEADSIKLKKELY